SPPIICLGRPPFFGYPGSAGRCPHEEAHMPSRSTNALLLAAMAGLAAASTARGQACNQTNPPPQSADVPDDSFIDANGDGIDGMRCGPIFVATTGSDGNDGTIGSPMRSVGAAILAAQWLTPTRSVYV